MSESLSEADWVALTPRDPMAPYDHFEPWMIGRLVEVKIIRRYCAPAAYGWDQEHTVKEQTYAGRLRDYERKGATAFRLEEWAKDDAVVAGLAPGNNYDSSVKLEVVVVPQLGDTKLALEHEQVRALHKGTATSVVVTHRIPGQGRSRGRAARRVKAMRRG